MQLVNLFKRHISIKRTIGISMLMAALTLLSPMRANAQELICTVQILSSQIQSSDKRAFETLRKAIYEFMNTRKWTNDQFRTEERIECSILINITKWNKLDLWEGTMQVQVRRPIYNSSYNSRILNINDQDCIFTYLEYDPLEFSESTHISNLTSILAFYAYIILGIDYDSYASKGGNPYFQKAQSIANNAQAAPEPGWKAFENNKKNKYNLVENILNQIYSPYRECLYHYHRHGLDVMVDDVNTGRLTILESLESLMPIHIRQRSSYILQVFFDAKADEIVKIFTEAPPDEQARVIKLLNKIDPANTTKYVKIIKK
ncbi:MAG TPA: DUF4835 family protein [Flavobacteriales bacterium]|nr:DUF4835 family protein [Flavobacteriales bacterium]HIO67239.1 DUF4835 family protein [Flavobacteriales bacterium]